MLESQKLPVIVNAALCWAWLAVYSLLEQTVLSSSANLNLGNISLSLSGLTPTVHGLTKAI